MKDVRLILLKSLIPVLETITGRKCLTRIPKETETEYPYVYISDIYQEENGPKTGFIYKVDLLVQVVHINLISLIPMFEDTDKILSMVNNSTPFEIGNPYKIESCVLVNSSTSEFQTETGTMNVGLVRLLFYIK